MGLSLTSIHIFGKTSIENCEVSFKSYSPDWLTCVDNLSELEIAYSYKVAKRISKMTDAPVLWFGVFDSDMIWFEFLRNGKCIVRYSDDESVSSKKLYDIPTLVQYEEGNKKRLSNILACSDIELKISMLEEFLGVCLLYSPEFADKADMLGRNRGDSFYRAYQEQEKELTGKKAPMTIRLVAEYPGKIFLNKFGQHDTKKPHFFLYGYTADNHDPSLTPMHFTDGRLEVSDYETFEKGHIPYDSKNTLFEMHYGTPCSVTFSEECPDGYRGKTMALPNGFYPVAFLPTHELLLEGKNKIYVVDNTLKIVAKLTVKGEVADVADHYILTATGDSFCGYCYAPGAGIYVYEIIKK